MIELIFTVLVFLSMGAVAIFVLGVWLQKKMSKDYKERGKHSPKVEQSDDWGRGD